MVTCVWDGPYVCSQVLTRGGGFGDCGPCCAIEALNIASCGKWHIGDRARRTANIVKIRTFGSPASGATKNVDIFRAYTSTWAVNQFKDVGRRAPKGKLMSPAVDWTDVFLPQLTAGRWASISVVYTRIDAYQGGAVSGQPGYTGAHQVVIGEYRVKSGNAWVTMVDPLADGRYSGVADGPQAIRLSVIADAAADFAGSGKASGWSFWPVGTLPGSDPGTGGGVTAVPNIVNASEASALVSISGADLVPGNRDEAYHATIVSGNVIASDPTAGTPVQVGSEVDYTVSLGTPPVSPSIDPDPPAPCDDPAGLVDPCGCGG